MSSEPDHSSATSTSEVGPRSLIVSGVPLTADLDGIYEDLNQNYADLDDVSRVFDADGQALGAIRVDFSSEEVVAEILDETAIYIGNRPHRVRVHWPRICYRCQNEGHVAAQCPQSFLVGRHLRDVVDEQNTQFQTTINEWEQKWNDRLKLIQTRSTVSAKSNSDLQQAASLVQQFKSVARQQTELANQMNKQLETIDSRVKTEIK